ncbi:MAG TPA: DNA-deoxyinosine glycosylase [Stellaceae bacterium]|nr:DNA-deoxyinosine glycosylase [Stellaceae bacterium]
MHPDHAVAAAHPRPDGGAARPLRRLNGPGATDPKRSFAPIVGGGPRALVLGTLPGEESLRQVRYYAHPRNLFWPIIFALFGQPLSDDYEQRVDFVRARRLALWDVCAAAERHTSLDTAIKREIPNPIHALLDAHPAITTIAFNGGTARRLYDRHFKRRAGLTYLHLPSTSPAHASRSFAEKLALWQPLRDALGD